MDLFQGGILTGEKIKIKNKNSNNSNINNTVDNNSESENQGTNSAHAHSGALNPGQLKRRHSSTLFAPKHAGMDFYFLHNIDIEKL